MFIASTSGRGRRAIVCAPCGGAPAIVISALVFLGCGLRLNDHPASDASPSPAPARTGGAGGGTNATGTGGADGAGEGSGGSVAPAAPDTGPTVTVDMGPVSCVAGETRCAASGSAVEVCTAAGAWVMKAACSATCQAGACAGMCKPGERQCGANQTPELCSPAGEWMPEKRCEFVCSGGGVCGGICQPGSKQCGGANRLTKEISDETGKWLSDGDCPNVCSNGSCGGTCMPGRKRCVGPNAEVCGPMGTWEPDMRCPFVCTGEGQCTGECTPGEKRCLTDAVETCGTDGRWQRTVGCPEGCSAARKACNLCKPADQMCSGTSLRTCAQDGAAWSNQTVGCCADGDCRPPANQVGRCDTAAHQCRFSCAPDAQDCGGGRCIPRGGNACCSDQGCSGNFACIGNTCSNDCRSGFKKCGNQCIPRESCCTDGRMGCGDCATCEGNGTCKSNMVTCYEDKDGDRYPNQARTSSVCGSCSGGFIPRRGDGKWDCFDDDDRTHPDAPYLRADQFMERGKPRRDNGTFDFNCDGRVEVDPPTALGCEGDATSCRTVTHRRECGYFYNAVVTGCRGNPATNMCDQIVQSVAGTYSGCR